MDNINHYEYFEQLLGANNIKIVDTTTRDSLDGYLVESRGRLRAKAPYILLPSNEQEVQEIVSYCYHQHIKIVPQGGNTGRCAGATPYNDAMVIVNLSNLNKVIEVNDRDNIMVVEAGVTLQTIIDEVAVIDRMFPLAIGAAGSCQIGGNIATNAGGYNVLKYGNCRQLILGLHVVLPDGELLCLDNKMAKNNIGYDIKHLFIGAEGSLGIITQATLSLHPKPKKQKTYLIGVHNYDEALYLLHAIKDACGNVVSAFEVMEQTTLETLRQYNASSLPYQNIDPLTILVEIDIFDANYECAIIDDIIYHCIEEGTVTQAYLAQSMQEAQKFWRVREHIVEAQKILGHVIKFDIAMPLSQLGQFCMAASTHLRDHYPNVVPYIFGHLGDGSLHFNVSIPLSIQGDDFIQIEHDIHHNIHQLCLSHQGTISAEHGIGRIKAHLLHQIISPNHSAMLCNIKQLLDPHHIMNMGVIIPDDDTRKF